LSASEGTDGDRLVDRYWQGIALKKLGDGLGVIEAYRSALSWQLLYPASGEVEEALKRLQASMQKGSGS
jgi:hypothetical protein